MQPLLNIYNSGKKIYLFERFDDKLVITEDDTFSPFYYEPDKNGKHKSYDNIRLRKVEVNHPAEIRKFRSSESYSSDVPQTKNYLIHKIDTIDKSKIKYLFLDIEVYAKTIPDVRTAEQPISCVSIYNSFTKDVKTWWILDYKGTLLQQEKKLLDNMMTYIVQEQPDLILSWNVDFDYTYLYNRYNVLYGKSKSFSNIISPINQSHSGNHEYETEYPAGISIMDYLAMFKKVFMREPSYTLDAVSQKYLKDKAWGSSNFGELTQDIKDKNINDVIRLQKLEDKFCLIEYFDEIRRLTKTEWEDLYHNSFIMENLLMIEARKKGIVLPNRPQRSEDDEAFEGAAREAVKTGALFDIGKFDLTSAYPNMVVNFCLDSMNIVDDDSGLDINGIRFQQDPTALLPTMVRSILELKDIRKHELNQLSKGTNEYTIAKIKYDAIKGVVNSAFGVMGFSSFRLYDNRVASAITFLVRDLLLYSREQIKKLGYDVIYWDTDSVFLTTKNDISGQLNQFIQDWAKLKGKSSINLTYEYEGYFSSIFIIALCRYIGTLVTKKGIEKEIKGAEAKRANSTKYEGQFQMRLIEQILNKSHKDSIIKWIENEKKMIKSASLEDIAFPCKSNSKQPVVMRAIRNTNSINPLNVVVGEVMWWIYVIPQMRDKDGKDIDVLAFTKADKTVLSKHKIDYDEIIRRNIQQKATTIFEANGWDTFDLQDSGQLSLI
jgi:DNA polymerase elongation subunit (family B)